MEARLDLLDPAIPPDAPLDEILAASVEHLAEGPEPGQGEGAGDPRAQLRALHPVGAAAPGQVLRLPAGGAAQTAGPAGRAARVRRLREDRAAGQGTCPACRRPDAGPHSAPATSSPGDRGGRGTRRRTASAELERPRPDRRRAGCGRSASATSRSGRRCSRQRRRARRPACWRRSASRPRSPASPSASPGQPPWSPPARSAPRRRRAPRKRPNESVVRCPTKAASNRWPPPTSGTAC